MSVEEGRKSRYGIKAEMSTSGMLVNPAACLTLYSFAAASCVGKANLGRQPLP